MIWQIAITPAAERDFKQLPKNAARRIKDELYALADELHPTTYVKKLKGHHDIPLYSLRVGQYRVILSIENDVMVIFVIEIGNRRNIYRKY